MRFSTPIYFQSIEKGAYDKTTGDYGDDTVKETEVYASVNDTGTTTMSVVYGGLRQGSITARIQNSYAEAFDYIRVGAKRYRVDLKRTLSNIQAFVLSEVQ